MDLSRRALVGLAGTALLSGCTRPGGPPGPDPSPTLTQAPVEAGGVNVKPADQVVQGGVVRQALASWPTSWNPWLAGDAAQRRTNQDAAAVRAALTAPAFLRDASGAAQPNPDVIVSAKAAGMPTVVTLTLNPKAVWGDGTPVTASDWVATAQAFRRSGIAAPSGWDRVSRVTRGSHDREVLVTFDAADPDWAEPLTVGCVRAAAAAPAAFAAWSTLNPAWFAGPYTVDAVQPDHQLITLKPNPRWWGSTPRLEQVFFRAVAPDAHAAAFAAGEFDSYPLHPSDLRRQTARSASDTTVLTGPGTTGRLATFATHGLWADPVLRQALIRGLDRERLARELAEVWGVAPVVWNNHLTLPSQPGYIDAALESGWRFDADAADRLFSEAGWKRSGDRLRRSGTPLTLTVTVPTGDPLAAAEASALAAVLSDRGIEVKPVTTGGDLGVSTVSAPVAAFRNAAGRLPAFPGLARLSARLDTTTEPNARAALAARAATLAWQSGASVPLYVAPESVVVRTKLANLGASGFSTLDWAMVGWTS